MRRYLAFLFLLASCTGCAAFEDMVFGPDPYLQEHAYQPPNSCRQNAAPPTVAQTQEPELVRTGR